MKVVFYVLLIVAAGVVATASLSAPNILGGNVFLKSFIGSELLAILAIITTVTAASVANIHMSFNRIEEELGRGGVFLSARGELNSGVYWLIGLFALTVIGLVFRATFMEPEVSVVALSWFNGLGLLVLLVNVLVLVDVTATVFSVPPIIK
jgi:hypothetical protein